MKLVFLDMDDTIADFTGSDAFKLGFDVSKMYEPGFFLQLKPVDGALVAVRQIIRMGYDVHILSQPVAESPHSYSEKIQWIGLWFPELICKVNLTQYKGHFKGDYLIDDNLPKWKDKFEANGGKFVHFQYNAPFHEGRDNKYTWQAVVSFLKKELENEQK
jgi:5'-nucleotidase